MSTLWAAQQTVYPMEVGRGRNSQSDSLSPTLPDWVGLFSALSTQVMGDSDFLDGAFPSQYSNALSGVFDMQIRNGNNQKYEHTFQLGILGIDLASEGPISRKHGSSYIFNYRFSTTSLATGNDMNLKYQDLSFKLNFLPEGRNFLYLGNRAD